MNIRILSCWLCGLAARAFHARRQRGLCWRCIDLVREAGRFVGVALLLGCYPAVEGMQDASVCYRGTTQICVCYNAVRPGGLEVFAFCHHPGEVDLELHERTASDLSRSTELDCHCYIGDVRCHITETP